MNCVCVSAVCDRQLHRRLAYRRLVPHAVPDHHRTRCLRHSSAARRRVLLRLADGPRGRRDGHGAAGARRPTAVSSDVPPVVSHRSSAAPAQPTVLRRVVAQYRRTQPDTAKHAIRSEDPDDDLPRDGPRCTDVDPVDYRQLDPTRLRKVGFLHLAEVSK